MKTLFELEKQRIAGLPIWTWAGLSSLFMLLIYALTLAPTTGWWDASEYITAAHVLGIPHPPGNPLFVITAHTWSRLLGWTGWEVAQRINLFAATTSALSLGLWFLVIVRIATRWTKQKKWALVMAGLGVLAAGTAFTVWTQSNLNEKVYTFSLLFVALLSYIAMLWQQTTRPRLRRRLFLLGAFLLGLGAANHLMSILPALALGGFILYTRPEVFRQPRLWGIALLLAGLGYSLQLFFLPIRSAQQPVLDEGDPECTSLVEAATLQCENLNHAIQRKQYSKPGLMERQAPFWAQMGNYFQYLSWQWLRPAPQTLRLAGCLLFLLLAGLGLYGHYRLERATFLYGALLLLTSTVLFVFYLNFKYGYSFPVDVDMQAREVRERDYFYLLSFQLWGLYAGVGAVLLTRQLQKALRSWKTRLSPAAFLCLLIPLMPLVINYSTADRSQDYTAREWAYNLLQSVPPYSVLFTGGDNDTFPLWYLQEVEDVRQDVAVGVSPYLGTHWYGSYLKRLTQPCQPGEDPDRQPHRVICQRNVQSHTLPAIYKNTPSSPPAKPIIALETEQLRDLPPVLQVGQNRTFRLGPHITLELMRGEQITRSEALTLHILQQTRQGRPVYFSGGATHLLERWELRGRLLEQGMAYRFVRDTTQKTQAWTPLSSQFTGRWVDYPRHRRLLRETLQLQSTLALSDWPDPSTRRRLPAHYYTAFMALVEASQKRQNPMVAQWAWERGQQLLTLTGHEQQSAQKQ